jgi:uncharacterized Fe-S cluster-containing radical SAM superfamily protein
MRNAVDGQTSVILDRKRMANAHLPRLAEGFVCGEITVNDICSYFRNVAHLYTVGIDVNATCNLKCGYCYLDHYDRRTAPQYVELESLYAFLEDVIEMGVDLIAVVGKEPFADERGIALLRRLDGYRNSGKQFRYGVVTNGTLLERFLDFIPSTISYIDFSLDGDEQTTDGMRGPGVYKKVLAAMRKAVDCGFDVWTSSVIYTDKGHGRNSARFMSDVVQATGCKQFYFSPVRNFTGELASLLLSFDAIERAQQEVLRAADDDRAIEKVILDHPYESVWRDYFPLRSRSVSSSLGRLRVDAFGNILDQLSASCFRKLDIFPHGPWGTCRIDARGEYLPDVESRAMVAPQSVGNIRLERAKRLHDLAVRDALEPMVLSFMANINDAFARRGNLSALETRSIPTWNLKATV